MDKVRALYRAWRYRCQVEKLEIAFLRQRLKRGQTVVDIGAHKGAFTYWMARLVGPQGHVYSFEPQPELASYLNRMKNAFNLQHVTIVDSALSSTPGTKRLFRPVKTPIPSATLVSTEQTCGESIAVSVDTLEHYFATNLCRPIHFIKCDVEGHELDVFRGGQKILREDRPLLLFECERRHHQDGEITHVFEYLESLGYEGYFFAKSWRAARPLDELEHRNLENPRASDYVYNFSFLPKTAA